MPLYKNILVPPFPTYSCVPLFTAARSSDLPYGDLEWGADVGSKLFWVKKKKKRGKKKFWQPGSPIWFTYAQAEGRGQELTLPTAPLAGLV